MEPDKIPSIKETFETNWQGLLLPIIILVPFIIDFFFNNATTFPNLAIFVDRLGKDGAKSYSSSLLFFVAGIAAVFAVIVMLFKDKKIVFGGKLNLKQYIKKLITKEQYCLNKLSPITIQGEACKGGNRLFNFDFIVIMIAVTVVRIIYIKNSINKYLNNLL